jgi:hypothetical protein
VSMVSPATRLSSPRTMVSTSGNSGTESGYRNVDGRGQKSDCRGKLRPASFGQPARSRLEARSSRLITAFHLCNLTSDLCNFVRRRLLPGIAIRYARAYTPAPADHPCSSHFPSSGKPVCATPGRLDLAHIPRSKL